MKQVLSELVILLLQVVIFIAVWLTYRGILHWYVTDMIILVIMAFIRIRDYDDYLRETYEHDS